MNVRDQVSKLETNIKLKEGPEERFHGYGVMGLTFKSGHVLALRRYPASSIGPGYYSVWHRNPKSEWTFYADTKSSRSCSRYFGEIVNETVRESINIIWPDDNRFELEITNIGFRWEVLLDSTPVTRVANLLAPSLPNWWWKNKTTLKLMNRAAGRVLGAGRLGLSGYVPNGQTYNVHPYRVWTISESHATLGRTDFGEPGPLPKQVRLADFWIPQKGMFVFGHVFFEAFDNDKHSSNYSRIDL